MQPQEENNAYADQAEQPQPQGAEGMDTFGSDQQASEPKATPSAPMNPVRRKKKKPIDLSFVTLGILAVTGVAGLYLIKTKCGPQSASASQVQTQQQIDLALVQLSTVDPRIEQQTRKLVEEIYYEAAQRQIPEDQVENNPFLLQLTPVLVDQSNQSQDLSAEEIAELHARAQAEQRKRKWAEYAQLLSTLELSSTIVRPDGKSTALINDFVLYQGETIQGWKIVEIRPEEVLLIRDDFSIVMKMSSR
ncbi:MAG: hypothetical protein ACLFUJ_11635 [Phycisphaerae bacterium]